jgi:Transposase DDE domain group 1
MLTLRHLATKTSFWREAQFDTIRPGLIKVAGRVTEMVTRVKIALPTGFPYQAGFAMLASRVAKLPPSPARRLPQIEPSGPTSNPQRRVIAATENRAAGALRDCGFKPPMNEAG